jgi:thioredoxin-like negative regulator of GroEL
MPPDEGRPAMRELSKVQLESWLKGSADTCFVFVYTPMCGTCKLAEKMLRIIEAMLPRCPLVRVNILELANEMEQWRIESVPCLLAIRCGIVIRKLYAFRSVDYLYQEILQLQSSADR